MPSWSKSDLLAYELRRKQSDDSGVSQSPFTECPVRNEPVAEKEGKDCNSDRVQVSILSIRKRLIDPDNLTPKFFVDCLRYGGFIQNDTEKDIIIQVSQRKVTSTFEPERTVITISRIDTP